MRGLFGTVGSFCFGVIIRIVPTEIPDLITWGLQNLAFLATIIAAYYTIKKAKREDFSDRVIPENMEEAQRVHAPSDESDGVGCDGPDHQST